MEAKTIELSAFTHPTLIFQELVRAIQAADLEGATSHLYSLEEIAEHTPHGETLLHVAALSLQNLFTLRRELGASQNHYRTRICSALEKAGLEPKAIEHVILLHKERWLSHQKLQAGKIQQAHRREELKKLKQEKALLEQKQAAGLVPAQAVGGGSSSSQIAVALSVHSQEFMGIFAEIGLLQHRIQTYEAQCQRWESKNGGQEDCEAKLRDAEMRCRERGLPPNKHGVKMDILTEPTVPSLDLDTLREKPQAADQKMTSSYFEALFEREECLPVLSKRESNLEEILQVLLREIKDRTTQPTSKEYKMDVSKMRDLINHCDKKGMSALEYVVELALHRCSDALLQAGADPFLKSKCCAFRRVVEQIEKNNDELKKAISKTMDANEIRDHLNKNYDLLLLLLLKAPASASSDDIPIESIISISQQHALFGFLKWLETGSFNVV